MKSTKPSIAKDITFSILLGVLVIVIGVSVTADRIIVSWLESEFSRVMRAKSNTLVTLTKQLDGGIEFDFADEFMPEFSRKINKEYFQIWIDNEKNEVLEKSDTLGNNSLPLKQSKALGSLSYPIILPDGRLGRVLQVHFIPQIPDKTKRTESTLAKQIPIYLSIASEIESLNSVILSIRLNILFAVLGILLLFYFVTRRSVKKGLKVLDVMSQQFNAIDIGNLSSRINIRIPPVEIKDLIDECNILLNRLEDSFEREKRFSSDVAHELKTPLTEIRSLSEIVLKWPESQSITEGYPQNILEICTNMESLVKDLLLLARFEGDHNKPVLNRVKLFDSILQAQQGLLELFSKNGINILNDIDVDQVVFVNESEWSMVLNNLLSNGAHHALAGSDLLIKSEIDGSNDLCIRFSNKVENFDIKYLKHVFEPFWREDTSRSGDGSGIGLSLVKVISKKNAYEVNASLQGGVFTISICGVVTSLE